MAKQRLNKNGTSDKRYGKKKAKVEAKGGKIQEIIDAKQAPGVHIAAHHKADWKPGMPDPDTPLDWSDKLCTGGDWGSGRPDHKNPEL